MTSHALQQQLRDLKRQRRDLDRVAERVHDYQALGRAHPFPAQRRAYKALADGWHAQRRRLDEQIAAARHALATLTPPTED